jgi:hypothetical protein
MGASGEKNVKKRKARLFQIEQRSKIAGLAGRVSAETGATGAAWLTMSKWK